MDKLQYKKLQDNARAYYASLSIGEVKKEFINDGLLNQNGKQEKGNLQNWGLTLTPSNLIGKGSMCGGKEGLCVFTCIAFTGVANMMKSKTFELSNPLKKAIRRNFLYIEDKKLFDKILCLDIQRLSLLYGNELALRLNINQDLDFSYIVDKFKKVKFYDYSKHHNRPHKKNYVITYSASERVKDDELKALLNKKFNVAVVFEKELPSHYLGFKVIDGDKTDNRYNDEKGVIVGLKQKNSIGGKTKTDFIKGLKE